jgi:hypothetical protein
MALIDEIAQAARDADAMRLRSLTQDYLTSGAAVADLAMPSSSDITLRAIAASLAELFAERRHEPPPPWAQAIGPAPSPIYLLRAAKSLRRLRALCEKASPSPLRRRNLFAPPTFLEFA